MKRRFSIKKFRLHIVLKGYCEELPDESCQSDRALHTFFLRLVLKDCTFQQFFQSFFVFVTLFYFILFYFFNNLCWENTVREVRIVVVFGSKTNSVHIIRCYTFPQIECLCDIRSPNSTWLLR